MFNSKFKQVFTSVLAAALVFTSMPASVFAEEIVSAENVEIVEVIDSAEESIDVDEVAEESVVEETVIEESVVDESTVEGETDLEIIDTVDEEVVEAVVEDEVISEGVSEEHAETEESSVSDDNGTYSDDSVIASDSEGDYKWKIDSKGKLTLDGVIPDKYADRAPVNWGGWTNYKNSIKSAIVNISGAENLSGMFSGCANLTTVDLSGMDASAVTTMHEMFNNCPKLKTVYVGSINTSNVTSMKRMFRNCTGIDTIVLGTIDTSHVTDMSGMFEGCTNLSEIRLSGINTSSVETFEGMFKKCKSLESLSLSSFRTSSAVSMASMFDGCTALKELDVAGFDTSNVDTFNRMFRGCEKLTDLSVSSFTIGDARSAQGMFSNCSSLTNLDLGDMDFSSVPSWGMNGFFTNCKALKTITTPKNVNGDVKLPASFYMPDGTAIKYLPRMDESVNIVKKSSATKPEDPITSAEIDLPFDELTLGVSKKTKYTVIPMVSTTNRGVKVVWSVVDENGDAKKGAQYLSVKNGKLEGKPAGKGHTVTVTAKLKHGKKSGDKASFTVHLVSGSSVELPETALTGADSVTYQVYRKSKGIKLPVMGQVAGNKGIKWTTSNSKIAKVTSSGKVVPKKKGEVTITAKLGSETVEYNIETY